MQKLLMCVAMVAMLAACSKGDGEDGFILSPMSDPDNVCSAMDDAYFMRYCYQNFDINGDAKISKAEAATVTSMRIDNYGVKSIRGIEYFVNLEDIYGVSLAIEVVDLRANTKLQKVGFSRCYDLVEVRLLNGVTSIEFSYCSSLASITIPEGVALISDYAFFGCSGLTSITIPNSVTSIGMCAFKSCSSLAKFSGKFASRDGRCLIVDGELAAFAPYGLTTYTIPNGVTSIGVYVFSECSSLASINIPNGVTSIGGHAFFGCPSLASITIPEGVTTIGAYAFSYCSSLTSITIPEGVTSIGNYAFYGCSSLVEVCCKPTTPPSIDVYYSDTGLFANNASDRRIYVPRASVNAYKHADGWRNYADYIEGYDF